MEQPAAPTPATIQDVARLAGVSRAAVSKVIRNAYGVSPEMRERVTAAIDQLSYRPRLAARTMRGPSFTIGVEIPEVGGDFFTQILNSAMAELEGSRYQLIVTPLRDSVSAGSTLQDLADRQVDGIVAISPLVSPEWLESFAVHVPVVVIGRHDDAAHYDTIVGDDRAGVGQVMDHLFELGHRDVVHLTLEDSLVDPWGNDGHTLRRDTYAERMRGRGLPERIVRTQGTELAAAAVTGELIASAERPTAIFAAHDTLAIGALRAVADAGLGPREVSVAGYDDVAIAGHPLVSLTSVDQHGGEVGRLAIRQLLERIGGRAEPRTIELAPTLRIRGSTARAPRDGTHTANAVRQHAAPGGREREPQAGA